MKQNYGKVDCGLVDFLYDNTKKNIFLHQKTGYLRKN